jgi:hypothetical protein
LAFIDFASTLGSIEDKLRLAFPAVMLDTNVTMREFFGGGKMIWRGRYLALRNKLETPDARL